MGRRGGLPPLRPITHTRAVDEPTLTTITLPWEDWRAIIAVLRQKGLASMLAHADRLEPRGFIDDSSIRDGPQRGRNSRPCGPS